MLLEDQADEVKQYYLKGQCACGGTCKQCTTSQSHLVRKRLPYSCIDSYLLQQKRGLYRKPLKK